MRINPEALVVELDGTAGSVRGARSATQRFLADAARRPPIGPDTARDVLMVVGELVANACRHAPGPCRLSVAVAAETVDVAVRDGGPARLDPGRRGSGYGLWIVARLTYGIRVLPVPGGKVVRAEVPLRGRRGAAPRRPRAPRSRDARNETVEPTAAPGPPPPGADKPPEPPPRPADPGSVPGLP